VNADEIVAASVTGRVIRKVRSLADALGVSRHFSGRLAPLGRDLQIPNAASSDDSVAAVVASGFAKAALGGLAWLERTVRESASAIGLERLKARIRCVAIGDRIRLVSATLLTAVAAHTAFAAAGAQGQTSAPGGAWLLVVLSIVAIVGARSIEAAWIDRSRRRSHSR
jgi:hypothetical protein